MNNKNLFTELRVIVAGQGKYSMQAPKISSEGLKKAFVDQENIRALGYDLKADGVARLAQDYTANSDMKPVYKKIKEYQPEVQASPMYPNFPAQVLEMDELTFRTHQFLHYLSTYGVESILDVEVSRGWLPETAEIQERGEDKHLLQLKVIDYLTENEVDSFVIEKVIGKKERLEGKQLEIAKEVVRKENRPMIKEIPFKENISALFADTFLTGSVSDIYKVEVELASGILKHPGDLLDLVEYLVIKNKYKHFRTTTKRALVELLEVFPSDAIEENLASNRWSKTFLGKNGKKRSRNRNISLIDYLSYSRFARNPEAIELVKDLRDGKLFSWGQLVEQNFANGELDEALKLLRQRPGVYFRNINRLLKNGADVNVIVEDMQNLGSKLKTQSIISAFANYDGSRNKDHEYADKIVDEVQSIFLTALVSNLGSLEVEQIAGKKVFIEPGEFDLTQSRIELTDKSDEGGYIQAGLAFKIPEEIETVRFLTYWNDKRRVDIDLHARFVTKDGESGHIGYYGSHKDRGLVFSGDITHSDAAEYIDLNFEKAQKYGISEVILNVDSFTSRKFKDIDTVFAGLMAVSKMNQKVKLYDSKNLIFQHDLETDSTFIEYGYIDVERRLLYLVGKSSNGCEWNSVVKHKPTQLSIKTYLDILIASQGATLVEDKEEADVILGLPKSDEENYFSLIDENYFMNK